KTQTHRRAKKVTELPQTSVPLDLGADEAVHKEGVDSVERAITTDASLVAEQDSDNIFRTQTMAMPNVDIPYGMDTEGHTSGSREGRMEHTFELKDIIPPTPHDSSLLGCYIPGSDEGRLKLEELMVMCTKLSKQVLDLEKEKDAQAVEIIKLKKRVKKLERHMKSSISHLTRRIYRQVESSDDDLDEEDATKQGRISNKTKPMFKDSDFDDLDDLVNEGMAFVQEKDAENQGKIGADDTEAVNTAGEGTLIKIKEEKAKEKGVTKEKGVVIDQGLAQIESDAELALRLHEEELAELDRAQKEKQKQEEATNAALAEEATLLAEYFERRKKQLAAERVEEIRNKPPTRAQTLEELQKLYQEEQKWINDFKPMDSEEDGSNTKKAGKRIKRIVDSTKGNEEAATDYEQEKEELRMGLAVVPNEDETVDPEILSVKYPIVDWESQNLGSVDMEDIHDWTLISWKLFENCGVHSLLMDGTLTCFNMLVEKRYPLIKEMLKKMLNWKLEAEAESTMTFKLLKFIKSHVEE
ncbi:hypothetical protein Tco_1024871, partial [Tanacetum coccineum]